MPSATVTSKGQITIPIEVRKALGLKPGVRDLKGCIPKLDHIVTLEEMDQAILDHAAELDAGTRSDANRNLRDGEAA
jgi:bifunctional DNA-binding transcriptional regulator/antitoxin component of YhaV-PrlF toxin-antitoxin module